MTPELSVKMLKNDLTFLQVLVAKSCCHNTNESPFKQGEKQSFALSVHQEQHRLTNG